MDREQTQELWDKLFPLQKGDRIVLRRDTDFGDGREVWVRKLKKGKKGIVINYDEGSPLIKIDFGIENWCHILERDRVMRDWELK